MMRAAIAIRMISDGNTDNDGIDDNDGNEVVLCTTGLGCRFLNNMVTASWSCESFDLVRGPKEGQIAPRPRITGVFLSTQSVP